MDMLEDKTFFTETMARLHAEQGRYAAAAKIYRYLLEQSPERTDLEAALDAVTDKLTDIPAQWGEVSDLVARWVKLMLTQQIVSRLHRIRLPRAH